MALAAADIRAIRTWVGSTVPTDGDLAGIWEQVGGGVHATALSVLRTRRADLLADPLVFSASGDWSQDSSRNLAALDQQIAALESLLGVGTSVVTTTQYVRPGTSR